LCFNFHLPIALVYSPIHPPSGEFQLFGGMIRELKNVRYVPQLNKNLISVGALEAQGLRGTFGEGVLKMSSGSLLVLKGI